ncbi:MAG: hypothetical protein FWH25_05025 [Syntrophorhabdaceae bacterium]|nr:hypothetical protein [Syntrophorhabdaceae bacterium]
MMYSLTRWHTFNTGAQPNFSSSLSRPVTEAEKAQGYKAGLYLYGAYTTMTPDNHRNTILRTLRASVKSVSYPGDHKSWMWRDAMTGEPVQAPGCWAYTELDLMDAEDTGNIEEAIGDLRGFMEGENE